MAKLLVHGKEGVLREIPLGQQRITIGRREDNDLCLGDKATSSQHAVIITIGRNSYLQDLKSTNGTLVNGSPVQKHTLKHGDVILIGRNHLSYVEEDKAAAVEKEAAAPSTNHKQPLLRPESTMQEDIGNTPASSLPPIADDQKTEYQPWAERTDGNGPPKTMVDSMLEAIRSHRETERTVQTQKKESIEREWKKLVEACQTLKTRVGGHPQVKFFDISRKQDEIMIRIQRSGEKASQHAILICREHPHNPSPHQKIWLIETGNADKQYETSEDIMRAVMSTMAPLIA